MNKPLHSSDHYIYIQTTKSPVSLDPILAKKGRVAGLVGFRGNWVGQKIFSKRTDFVINIRLMETKSASSQLRDFFLTAVRQSFWQLGIFEPTIAGYIADVLTEFARSDRLYRMRSKRGTSIDSVVEMLAHQPAPGTDENQLLRERALRKYVGDYALFMSGVFRSYVEGRGVLDYYLDQGSRSYWTVSELDLSLYRTGFILFQDLSKKFEYYSGALDYTRKAYFASEPGEDPFSGFLRHVAGWMKVNLTEN